MIKRDGRGHSYFGVRGEILGSLKDGQMRKHLPRTSPLIKNESQRFEDDQTPSLSDHKRCQLAIRSGCYKRTLRAPSGKPKCLGSGGSMVAKLKLKGIDGRAPPGVEPAA